MGHTTSVCTPCFAAIVATVFKHIKNGVWSGRKQSTPDSTLYSRFGFRGAESGNLLAYTRDFIVCTHEGCGAVMRPTNQPIRLVELGRLPSALKRIDERRPIVPKQKRVASAASALPPRGAAELPVDAQRRRDMHRLRTRVNPAETVEAIRKIRVARENDERTVSLEQDRLEEQRLAKLEGVRLGKFEVHLNARAAELDARAQELKGRSTAIRDAAPPHPEVVPACHPSIVQLLYVHEKLSALNDAVVVADPDLERVTLLQWNMAHRCAKLVLNTYAHLRRLHRICPKDCTEAISSDIDTELQFMRALVFKTSPTTSTGEQ
jgi:hypothetical protein